MIKLDISHLSWQLNKSFNISRGSKNTAETIEVKLTDNKFIGIGECVPYGRYNETLESVQKEILEDLIIAAISDAKQKGESAAQEEMKSVTGGIPLPPGMKLPF